MVYADKKVRGRMIADISAMLICDHAPTDVRGHALALIGWLARRMPGEPAIEWARMQRLLHGDGLP